MSALRSTKKKPNGHVAKLTGKPFYSRKADNSGLLYVCFGMEGLVLLYEMNVPHNANIPTKLRLQQHPVINSY